MPEDPASTRNNHLHLIRGPYKSHITITWAVIQKYIQGLNHVTPAGEQQDFKMNSEAQQQHEGRQR